MIPNPDAVTAALEGLSETMDQFGWDKPPLVCVLRKTLSKRTLANMGVSYTDEELENGFSKLVTQANEKRKDPAARKAAQDSVLSAQASVDAGMPSEPALVAETTLTPYFTGNTIADFMIMAAGLCYPTRIPRKISTPKVVLDLFDDDFAGLVFGFESWTSELVPDDYEGSVADLPDAREMRVLLAVDTVGTNYVTTHYRNGERRSGRSTINGEPVGQAPLNDYGGDALATLFTAVLGICHNYLTPTAFELPPLEPGLARFDRV